MKAEGGHPAVVGATWQRCRVHFAALSYVPEPAEHGFAALRQAFIQPDRPSASQTLRHVADQLRLSAELGAFIDESETDAAHMDFPTQHRPRSIRQTRWNA